MSAVLDGTTSILNIGTILGTTDANSGAMCVGVDAKSLPDTDYTLSLLEAGALFQNFSGTLTAGRNIIAPTASGALYFVKNGTAQTLTFKTSAGTGVAITTGKVQWVICDGTNYIACSSAL